MNRRKLAIVVGLGYAVLSLFCFISTWWLPPTWLLVLLGPPLLLGWGVPMIPYYLLFTLVLALIMAQTARRSDFRRTGIVIGLLVWLFGGIVSIGLGY